MRVLPQVMATLALAAVLAGCGKTPAPTPAPQPTPQPAAPAAAADANAPIAVDPPGPSTPTQAEVDALLGEWLATQNQGRFADYQSLYAARMTGVRRTGAVVKRLDRAHWMADRKVMFAKIMQVSIGPAVARLNAQLTQVDFVQKFATGTFADEGPKRLLLVREGDKLRIAREEMLASTLQAGADIGTPPKSTELALAFTTESGAWLVIGPPEPATPTAPPQLLSRDAVAAAWRSLPLPRGSEWIQRDVVLYGPQGEMCRGQADEAGLLVRMRPHFGQREQWQGGESSQPMRDRAIATEIWDQAAPAAQRAVHIAATRGRCLGALWGRASNLPPPVLLARAEMPGGQLRESALDALRVLPSYQRIAKEYLSSVPAPRPVYWDLYDNAKAEVVAFSGQGKQWALVRARAGAGCGDFFGEIIGLFTAKSSSDGKFALQLQSPERGVELQWPAAAADVDGDGHFEWIGPTQIWREVGPTVRPVFEVDIPDFDCPC